MKRRITIAQGILSLALLAACVDNHILPSDSGEAVGEGIAFSASVAASRNETRADGSLVNRQETWLPPTDERTYWVPETDQYGNLVFDDGSLKIKEKKVAYYAGLFGCLTGSSTWSSYETAHNGSKPTADFFFNQKAEIKPYQSGVGNLLDYAPERFWPNTRLAGSDNQYERASFWAYYPWNATDDPGAYGIAITKDEGKTYGVGSGQGMGSVKFTMHPDASEQSDFLVSDLVTDCSKDTYPLLPSTAEGDRGWTPKRVPLRFHHLLAQVRLYAFIRGVDKMVYLTDAEGNPLLADAKWFETWESGETLRDEYGNVYTKKGADLVEQTTKGEGYNLTKEEFLKLKLRIPDEAKCVRWDRADGVWDVTHSRRRANITYTMSFNNIHTSCIFRPIYEPDPDHAGMYRTRFTYEDLGTLGSTTVNHYIQNPYWFRFDESGRRIMLNDNYMYDYFEDTKGYKAEEATEEDGMDWSNYGDGNGNAMGYVLNGENADRSGLEENKLKHYNYAPGNIILAVPQEMSDDDVPHIIITAMGLDEAGNTVTGKVTINMLNMNLKWESGFIYSYAFVDDIAPGDDKVRGPETITVVFDPTRITDQW